MPHAFITCAIGRQLFSWLLRRTLTDRLLYPQEDQSFLESDQMSEGFVLLCVANATSDVVVQTHQEDALH
jgi:hypothetical protein